MGQLVGSTIPSALESLSMPGAGAGNHSSMGDLLTSVQFAANDSLNTESGMNNGLGGSNESFCSNMSTDKVSEYCRFWIQGILLCVVGIIGIIGNTVSIVVLSRPEMLSVFNQILVVMTAFDTVYLLTSIAEFSFVESFHLTSEWYDRLFVYFLYPLHNITLCCSIFSHVVLAFERYLAVCHPEKVFSNQPRARNTAHQRNAIGHSGPRVRRRNPAYPVVRKKVGSPGQVVREPSDHGSPLSSRGRHGGPMGESPKPRVEFDAEQLLLFVREHRDPIHHDVEVLEVFAPDFNPKHELCLGGIHDKPIACGKPSKTLCPLI
eukprot:maker-scaffold267_size230776-snap-gene-1.27 protein:Tk02978 transcript:maker-scaffold267_size230776-snap-gene-1.27-mRNA-1 annotation:"fmrfamide receptor-like isoform x1"